MSARMRIAETGKIAIVNRRKMKIILFFLFILAGNLTAQITTEALLDTIQHTAFNYFWNEANPANGLIRESQNSTSTKDAPCSIAAVGFGLTAICIGVDHGWVSRQTASERVLTTLKTFWYAPQGVGNSYTGIYGLFYHFLDMNSATRTRDSELSTIDTALLLAGLIDMKQYFTGPDSTETQIRNLSDSIYYRMNWDLMRNYNPGILMAWMPNTGFAGYNQWVGYNEATLMYIFALGSPTHPVDYDAWMTWTQGFNPNFKNQYGYTYINFPPLFGHQYSHCWIDFRNIADDWMRDHNLNYFENSRRATLAQRAYSIANPKKHLGYSDSLWGITASDTPTGYVAHGAPPEQNDDGTIVPTAPISSLPFAPEAVIPVIKNMWNNYRPQLWTKFGFRDAFNLNVNWWGPDALGIDQGPMIIMIENYRNQSVWNRFMKNPDVQRGLAAAKFTAITSVNEASKMPTHYSLAQNFPNPCNPSTTIRYSLPTSSRVSLKIFNILGQQIADLVNTEQSAGWYETVWNATVASGLYFYRIDAVSTSDPSQRFTQLKKMMLIK